jgi:hypothetical protein
MAWQPLNLHFRQIFDGGYRYLDRTGDFMVAAESEHDLVPGEIQVTGAKLEKPEDSISIAVNSKEIRAQQDFPSDGGSPTWWSKQATIFRSPNWVEARFDFKLPIATEMLRGI